jgi:hypothetical protein
MTRCRCELAAPGYSRNGKRDNPDISAHLICIPKVCTVWIEFFSKNAADPKEFD